MTFDKLLIANRGEIAVRIIRACKEMGIKTVAVFSDADKDALHVKYADEAVNIGPALSRKSYLNIDNIIQAATEKKVDAVHPGYGFLSENADFAKACVDHNLIFIGPSAECIAAAGNKSAARKTLMALGISIIPGSDDIISSKEEAFEVAADVGYPVILKASGGGGGRGMRIAHDKEELADAFAVASGEARAAFGNPDLYLEKYIERVARSVGYSNAGTMEFLVDKNKNFYFMEVNARLQVEHPVTELVTGIDIVQQQILLAQGDTLTLKQDEIHLNGWSIECRINAADPADNFMPSPGVIKNLILPGGPGVRVDTHIFNQYEISPFYDSLIGKLVVWAENRYMAIKRMQRALSEFRIEGIASTVPFHQSVFQDEDFIQGDIDTHFLEKFDATDWQ
jgi:acetyl-CoA carboxylase biotin carboxylase subunit